MLTGLQKALDAVVKAEGSATVIVNPHYGDLSGAGEALTDFLNERFVDLPGVSAGILLKQGTMLDAAMKCYEAHSDHTPAFIHAGFTEAKSLAEKLGGPRGTSATSF